MRPRRLPARKPPSEGPFYAALFCVSGAYAFWCHADHAVLVSQTVDGVKLHTVGRNSVLELGAFFDEVGWRPRVVLLTLAGLQALLSTTWEAGHLVTPELRVPVAMVPSANSAAAAALYATGEPLWPDELPVREGGDAAG